MGKFSINDILSERSKAQDMQSEEVKTDGIVELIDIYKMIPSQENFYDVTKHMDLVNSIKLFGILQPLLLSESEEEDMYGINAGHRRREACLYLVEQEGLEKYRYVPAIVKPHQDDVMENLTIIMANRFRNKTDWEKMQEVVKTEALLAELKGNKSLNRETRKQLKELLGIEGEENLKTRDFVAEILGMSSTQVGRYNAIYNNLCIEFMKMFQENQLSVSVAAEIAGLSPDWQNKAYEMIQKGGSIQIADVKKLKQQEEASKPLEGQQTIEEVAKLNRNEVKENCVSFFYEMVMTEEEKVLAKLRSNRELQEELYSHHKNSIGANGKISWRCQSYEIHFVVQGMEDIKMSWFGFVNTLFEILDREQKQEIDVSTLPQEEVGMVTEETEQFEAKPEYKDILCYSCLYYAECDQKTRTVFKCDTYKNKAEAEKTEEQLYSEEQDRIDRETARKIEEMKQKDMEEKSLPCGDKREPRDDFEISVTTRQYSEIYYGHVNFLVTPKKDYRFDDKITFKEYRRGEASGKEIVVKVKNVVQDCTGIEDGYCVIGFYTVPK